MRKEFYDMKVRFIGVLIVTITLFFIVAPFQKFTISMLEGYSENPQVEKFLPGAMLNKLKEWNFYISLWYTQFSEHFYGIVLGCFSLCFSTTKSSLFLPAWVYLL